MLRRIFTTDELGAMQAQGTITTAHIAAHRDIRVRIQNLPDTECDEEELVLRFGSGHDELRLVNRKLQNGGTNPDRWCIIGLQASKRLRENFTISVSPSGCAVDLLRKSSPPPPQAFFLHSFSRFPKVAPFRQTHKALAPESEAVPGPKEGCCPTCGKEGVFRMMALCCPDHGAFAGI